MATTSLAHRPLAGRAAELLASLYLQARGCVLLARGVRIAGVQVDILAKRRGVVLVVEVKSRGRADVPTEDLVTPVQVARLRLAADRASERHGMPARLDLVEVRWGGRPFLTWHHGPWDPV
jgi:putative endonuclease